MSRIAKAVKAAPSKVKASGGDFTDVSTITIPSGFVGSAKVTVKGASVEGPRVSLYLDRKYDGNGAWDGPMVNDLTEGLTLDGDDLTAIGTITQTDDKEAGTWKLFIPRSPIGNGTVRGFPTKKLADQIRKDGFTLKVQGFTHNVPFTDEVGIS